MSYQGLAFDPCFPARDTRGHTILSPSLKTKFASYHRNSTPCGVETTSGSVSFPNPLATPMVAGMVLMYTQRVPPGKYSAVACREGEVG